MKKIAEMIVSEYFNLSSGSIALVGLMFPDIDDLLTKCKAYLYIGNKKVRTIDIIGEDKFSGANKEIKNQRRSVRTIDNIYDDLKSSNGEQIKLIFYME